MKRILSNLGNFHYESGSGKNRFEKHPIITLIIIFLLFLLMAEISMRLYIRFSSTPAPTMKIYNLLDEKVHHDFFPSNSFVAKPPKSQNFKPVNVKINSFGIRGPELKAKSLYRVLNVGDSYVEAREVNFEDTFGERLNRYFEGKIEIISHGISSWSPTTEFSWIYHKGIGLKPDEINLFLCVNDFFRCNLYNRTDECYRKDAIYDGIIPVGYRHSYSSPPPLHGTLFPFRHRIKLYTFITERMRDLPFLKGPIVNEMILLSKDASEWPEDLRQNVDSTIDVVLNLNNFLLQKNITLNVLMTPSGYAWENEPVKAYAWKPGFTVSQKGIEQYLHEKLEAQGIRYVELRKSFSSHEEGNPNDHLFNTNNAHWNSKGHKIIFDVLRDEYDRRQLTAPGI